MTALCASTAHAASVEGVRVGIHGDSTRLVLDLSAAAPYRVFVMQSPYRLAIDMPSFDWQVGQIARPKGSGVSGVREGALNDKVSRIVVDLAKPADIRAVSMIPGTSHGNRLVIDFSLVSQGAFTKSGSKVFGTLKADATPSGATSSASTMAFSAPMPEKVPLPKASASDQDEAQPVRTPPKHDIDEPAPRADDNDAAPPPKQASRRQSRDDHQNDHAAAVTINGEKPLIVIDPGHGGIDPGSLGVNGLFEKNVTIGMARELKRELEASGRYRVLMTRDSDVYLKLGERVAFARDHHANLFISLHADSIARSGVSGASIYTLSDKASDAQTAKLAQRENHADMIGGLNMDGQDQDVANILVDLVMRDNMNQSRFFANSVVDNMRQDGIVLLENTHRAAGFAVLKAPDIPSVLIELGFMTNAKESAQLMSPLYRQKIAAALISGIDSYFQRVGKANRT